jgi:hypothetical protein
MDELSRFADHLLIGVGWCSRRAVVFLLAHALSVVEIIKLRALSDLLLRAAGVAAENRAASILSDADR